MQTVDMKMAMGNSKTGPAWSLREGRTCPGATSACKDPCYPKHGRMNTKHPIARRDKNKDSVMSLMVQGVGALVEQLIAMWHQLKTVRLHDAGDFFNPAYTTAVKLACAACPGTKFWAYTRSFTLPLTLKALVELAALRNVAIWLSADRDNYKKALDTLDKHPVFSGIAFMQSSEEEQTIALEIQALIGKKRFINFPVHLAFGRQAVKVKNKTLRNCPAIDGPLKPNKVNPPCLTCRLCLPE